MIPLNLPRGLRFPANIWAPAAISITLVCAACGGGGGSSSDGASGELTETALFEAPADGRPSRLVLEENFDTGGYGPLWNDAVVRTEYYPSGDSPFEQFSGHGFVMHQVVPPGTDDVTSVQVSVAGAAGMQAVTGTNDVDEFYVEWDEYFPADHDFANQAQKLLRFVRSDAEDGTQGAQVNLQMLYENTDLQLSFYHQSGVDVAADIPFSFPPDQWTRLGVWCRLNTPGQSDGFGRVYVNGQLVGRLENLNNRGSDSRGWDLMWVGGNHTNQTPTTQLSHRYTDNIRWYSR